MLITYPAVKKVKPTDDYKIFLTFSNGEIRLFDMKPYLKKEVFIELLNLAMFNTVHISFDTIEWDVRIIIQRLSKSQEALAKTEYSFRILLHSSSCLSVNFYSKPACCPNSSFLM